MKFIFEYVTCCMMSTPPCNTTATTEELSSPRTEDESRSLVTAVAATESRICRRRKRTPTRGSSADWRPSLFAISEDNAVAAAAAATEKKVVNAQRPAVRQPSSSSSQRNVKQCGASSGRVNAISSRSYEYSRDPLPLVVPTFSAAPFMF